MGLSKRLLADAYGDEIEWTSCDPCDWTVDREKTSHGYAYGIETTACSRCTGSEDGYDECELHGRTWPSSATEAAESMWGLQHLKAIGVLL